MQTGIVALDIFPPRSKMQVDSAADGSCYRNPALDPMPFIRHYLASRNFILTRVIGRIDDSQLREHVLALNSEAVDLHAILEIVDCRDVKDVEHITAHGATAAAALEKGHRRAKEGRLAILVGSNQVVFGLARAYATFAEDARAHVTVCRTMTAAIEFLGLTAFSDEVTAFISTVVSDE